MEPPFFVTGLRCSDGCDPDNCDPLFFPPPRRKRAVRSSPPALRNRATAARAGCTRSPRKRGKSESTKVRGRRGRSRALDADPFRRGPGQLRVELHSRRARVRGGARAELQAARALDASLGRRRAPRLRLDGEAQNLHQAAFLSFGSGHGVWEASGGSELPFSARNLQDLREWVSPLTVDALFPTIQRLEEKDFGELPPRRGKSAEPLPRRRQDPGLRVEPHGRALRPAAPAWSGRGCRSGVRFPGRSFPSDTRRRRNRRSCRSRISASRVKDSPQYTLVFVTTLDRAVPSRELASRSGNLDNKMSGAARPNGRGRARAGTRCANPKELVESSSFLVTAEKDGDLAYVASNWNEGIVRRCSASTTTWRQATSDPPRRRLHGSRRVQARRAGSLQGDLPVSDTADGIRCCRPDLEDS